MKIQSIKKRSAMFTFATGEGWDLNLHLIMANKYNYLIDTGLGPQSVEPVLNYLASNTEQQAKPLVVINTHFHWDHIWGNALFKEGLVVAHKNCPEEINRCWQEMSVKNQRFMAGHVEKYLPNVLFEDELYFAEDGIRLFYTPGHSRDGISVLDEVDGVLNAGDNIGDNMEELVPSIDGDHEVYRQTLLKYKALDFDTCLSGHNIALGKDVVDSILNLL